MGLFPRGFTPLEVFPSRGIGMLPLGAHCQAPERPKKAPSDSLYQIFLLFQTLQRITNLIPAPRASNSNVSTTQSPPHPHSCAARSLSTRSLARLCRRVALCRFPSRTEKTGIFKTVRKIWALHVVSLLDSRQEPTLQPTLAECPYTWGRALFWGDVARPFLIRGLNPFQRPARRVQMAVECWVPPTQPGAMHAPHN